MVYVLVVFFRAICSCSLSTRSTALQYPTQSPLQEGIPERPGRSEGLLTSPYSPPTPPSFGTPRVLPTVGSVETLCNAQRANTTPNVPSVQEHAQVLTIRKCIPMPQGITLLKEINSTSKEETTLHHAGSDDKKDR